MSREAGKGDKRRPTDNTRFDKNYSKIKWGKSHGNSQLMTQDEWIDKIDRFRFDDPQIDGGIKIPHELKGDIKQFVQSVKDDPESEYNQI